MEAKKGKENIFIFNLWELGPSLEVSFSAVSEKVNTKLWFPTSVSPAWRQARHFALLKAYPTRSVTMFIIAMVLMMRDAK